MFSAKQFRELILALLGIAVAAGIARAQPQRQDFWTVEARVGQADQVIVGTISKVSWKTIVAQGGADKIGTTWPDGQFEYTLTLKIGEALKGNLNGIVDDLRPQFITWSDERYDQWMGAETSMLWLLGPTPERGQRRDWDFVPLGEPVPAERAGRTGDGGRIIPTTSASQGQRGSPSLRTGLRQDIAEGAADPSDSHPARLRSKSGQWDYLIVPVEPTLEERAKRLMAAPQEFMPKGENPNPDALRMLRFGGVDSLRYFKSDANAELLRSLLDEPPTANEAKPSVSGPTKSSCTGGSRHRCRNRRKRSERLASGTRM